jgi:hypothetical protein
MPAKEVGATEEVDVMHTVTTIQTRSPRGLWLGVAAAAALSVAAFVPAANATQPYAGASLGINGSANAVEHRLLSHLSADLGAYGSANAVEHRLLSSLIADLGVGGSANAVEQGRKQAR